MQRFTHDREIYSVGSLCVVQVQISKVANEFRNLRPNVLN